MIGSTVKLGFDATAVQKGLGGLGGIFGRIGRQIGIGGLRQVGAQVTDLMGRIILAVPQAGREMLDWAGNMTDMSAQTGVAIQELLVMEEALRNTGASAADTSRIMSVFKDNLFEASQGADAQKEALNKLGFSAQDFRGVKLDQSFYAIGKRVAELGPDFEGLEGIMADLFGARMGYKMIRFFRDFEGSMAIARKNVSSFNNVSDDTFTNFDNISDIMGRWTMTRRSLLAGFLEGVLGEAGIEKAGQSLDSIFDKVNGMSDKMREFGKVLRTSIEYVAQTGVGNVFSDMFKGLGKSIGEGIAESIRESISPKGFIQSMNPFAPNKSDPLLKESQKQTAVLTRIQRDGITAKYA
jgi:hypothetical protein